MEISDFLNSQKEKYGFTWGYTETLDAYSYEKFQKWIISKHNAKLKYLEGERGDKRRSLVKVWDECKSAVIMLFPNDLSSNIGENGLKLAKFAVDYGGVDYHYILNNKMQGIGKFIKRNIIDSEFKTFIDTAPILERDFAYQAGLGWIGKNSMLLNQEMGSFFMIGIMLFNKELNLEKKERYQNLCGNCSKCIDACPTSAILANGTIDCNKCIAHYTVELFKEEERPLGYDKRDGYIFGCDICQDVCPWNNKIGNNLLNNKENKVRDFLLNQKCDRIINILEKMSNREYIKKFKGTSIERVGRKGLLKNIKKY